MQKLRSWLFERFTSIEILTFLYSLFTAVYILCFYNKIANPFELLLYRIAVIALIFFASWCYKKYTLRAIEFIRFVFPLVLIIYWYPETYYLTHGVGGIPVFVPNLDLFFDQLDVKLFNCVPAMEFSKRIPYAWFSEIMYFSYFFYYFIYAYIAAYFFFCKRNNAYQVTFIILMSFFLFYILFVFIPVEGPQFFWTGEDVYVPDGYFFSWLMRAIQSMGEMPTGAFPSSHVGITFIFMIILFKFQKKAFWIFLPVVVCLFMSTVYIKAHYLIDVVAAFIVTPFIYIISDRTYRFFKKKFPAMDFSL